MLLISYGIYGFNAAKLKELKAKKGQKVKIEKDW